MISLTERACIPIAKLILFMEQEQLDQIHTQAAQAGQSETDYILAKLGIQSSHKLDFEEVLRKIDQLIQPGEDFCINQLFLPKEFEKFSRGSKLSVGRAFRREVENGALAGKYLYLGTKNNQAHYQKL